MKIAIIGATGLLGSNIVKLFSKSYDIKSFSRKNAKNVESDKNNIIDFNEIENELTKYFDIWKPDIIINTIAIVNLQVCEDDIIIASYINSNIAQKIAKISLSYSSYFIHISTDHYYNDNNISHDEEVDVVLLNNYAKTKYDAEKEIVKLNNNFLIVRTNIIGFRMRNAESFFEWIIKSLVEQDTLNLYTNFYTSPISVNELGNILIKCYEKNLIGTYNIASRDVIDKYTFGIKTAKKFGFKCSNINKSIISNNDSNLMRALSLGLDVSKIEKALAIKMPTIDETLNNLYNEYKENNE